MKYLILLTMLSSCSFAAHGIGASPNDKALAPMLDTMCLSAFGVLMDGAYHGERRPGEEDNDRQRRISQVFTTSMVLACGASAFYGWWQMYRMIYYRKYKL